MERRSPAVCKVSDHKEGKDEMTKASIDLQDLSDRDERNAMRVKHLDDLGEIRERTSQAVDLIDDDGVDPMRDDVGQ